MYVSFFHSFSFSSTFSFTPTKHRKIIHKVKKVNQNVFVCFLLCVYRAEYTPWRRRRVDYIINTLLTACVSWIGASPCHHHSAALLERNVTKKKVIRTEMIDETQNSDQNMVEKTKNGIDKHLFFPAEQKAHILWYISHSIFLLFSFRGKINVGCSQLTKNVHCIQLRLLEQQI